MDSSENAVRSRSWSRKAASSATSTTFSRISRLTRSDRKGKRPMITIGLTGGIGSGKSTVAAMLQELGAPVLDADKFGHAIYEPGGPAYHDVVSAFGKGIVGEDGTIDRKKLGA